MPFNSFLDHPMSWKPDRASLKRPVYRSLAGRLEEDILKGYLAPGTKLPPQRELADFLDINFTTVTRAYRICELKGLIYAVTGSGTFVAASGSEQVTISAGSLADEVIDLGFVASFESCNDTAAEAVGHLLAKKDLQPLLDYSCPEGMPHQRAAGANWLKGIGLDADADHIVIVSGTQNGLALTLLALFEPGSRIAVDTYTYANFIELARMFHLQLVPVAGDDEGMSASELENAHRLNPLHGVFLMPSCCNPTTVMISEHRKHELAGVIEKYGLVLIEDDIHAFFTAGVVPDYCGPVTRLVSEHAVYICGTSKPICSGLRVAFLVYPDRFKEQILRAVFNMNVKTPSLNAEIITRLILSGKAAETVRRKTLLAESVNSLFFSFFPEAEGTGHPLSFYRWIPLPVSLRGAEAEDLFLRSGIRVYHSDRFLPGAGEKAGFLRIALSSEESPERLSRGLAILAETLKDLSAGRASV